MKKSFSILTTLLIKIGIILAALLVMQYLVLRIDLSAQKAYSLSKVSKKIVRSLDDIIVLKIVASPDLPADMNSLNRYLQDLLSEYQVAARGKFRYEYLRNLERDELFGMAYANNLNVMRFQIYEKDQIIAKEVVFGIIFEYQGKVESLSLAPGSESKLEYELNQRIQSLSQYSLPKVGVFRDTTYYDFPTRYFERSLRLNFAVQDIDLTKPIQGVDAVLFTGTARSLPEEQLYHLDQYIMQGGKVVFLQDRTDVDNVNYYPLDTNVIDMLKHYGFELSRDVILDITCEKRQTGLGVYGNFHQYPVLRGGDHPITRNMENIVLYVASGISFCGQKDQKFIPILQSSIYSGWLKYPDFKHHPNLYYDSSLHEFDAGPITAAAIIEGRFSSYFTGSKLAANDPNFIAKSPKLQIPLFGDKDLVIDPDRTIYLNRHFVILNALDYLSGREDYIRIRSRQLSNSSLNVPRFMYKMGIEWGDLPRIDNGIKLAIKIIAIALPVLILLLYALFSSLRRKALLEQRYE